MFPSTQKEENGFSIPTVIEFMPIGQNYLYFAKSLLLASYYKLNYNLSTLVSFVGDVYNNKGILGCFLLNQESTIQCI